MPDKVVGFVAAGAEKVLDDVLMKILDELEGGSHFLRFVEIGVA